MGRRPGVDLPAASQPHAFAPKLLPAPPRAATPPPVPPARVTRISRLSAPCVLTQGGRAGGALVHRSAARSWTAWARTESKVRGRGGGRGCGGTIGAAAAVSRPLRCDGRVGPGEGAAPPVTWHSSRTTPMRSLSAPRSPHLARLGTAQVENADAQIGSHGPDRTDRGSDGSRMGPLGSARVGYGWGCSGWGSEGTDRRGGSEGTDRVSLGLGCLDRIACIRSHGSDRAERRSGRTDRSIVPHGSGQASVGSDLTDRTARIGSRIRPHGSDRTDRLAQIGSLAGTMA